MVGYEGLQTRCCPNAILALHLLVVKTGEFPGEMPHVSATCVYSLASTEVVLTASQLSSQRASMRPIRPWLWKNLEQVLDSQLRH